MSTLKVDTILKRTGTGTITVGQSGDTISIPTGATLTVAGSTISSADMGPAFFATLSADTNISDDTSTKVQCNTEVFDTDSAYDNSTNYRFTPQTAGKYYVFGYCQINAGTGLLNQFISQIKKNGSIAATSESDFPNDKNTRMGKEVSAIIDFNGSSDYVELFVTGNVQSGTVSVKSDSGTKTRFGAYRILGA